MNAVSKHRYNEIFIDLLEQLSKLHAKQGEVFRARAYKRAEETIREMSDTDLTSVSQLRGKPNIGSAVLEKLQEYLDTGKIEMLEREKGKPEYLFSEIHGIGPKKAKEIVEKGVTTIEGLRARQDELLNDVQKKGLKYFEDTQKRIPRTEIDQFQEIFLRTFLMITRNMDKDVKKDAKIKIVGSYRRGAESSGDIDVIITGSKSGIFETFIEELQKTSIILEVLSCGKTKCLVIARLPNSKVARRVDFMFTPLDEYPFAILYFTGSKTFNTMMRSGALKQGYSLNEHGLYIKPSGKAKEEKVSHTFKDERDIFDFLKMPWREPRDREQGPALANVAPSIKPVVEPIIEPKKKRTYKKRINTSSKSVPKTVKKRGRPPKLDRMSDDQRSVDIRDNVGRQSLYASKIVEKPEPKLEKEPEIKNKTVKKRGRPPKLRIVEKEPEPEKNKTIKKRGRPPKLKIVEKPLPKIVIKDEIAPIIPVIPLEIDENKKEKKEKKKEEEKEKEKPIKLTKKEIKTSTHNKTIRKMSSKVSAKNYINQFKLDGISILESLPESTIESMIITANDAYYNKKPLMSDNEYDILREYAEKKFPQNMVIREVGAPVVKNKVTLPYNMPSMDKIKPDTGALGTWMTKYKGPYVLSCKLDGVSGMYIMGKTPKLYTRGDGKVGQDISHFIKRLNKNFPEMAESNKDVVVRGEFVIPKKVFQDKYQAQFANARNMVSGIINSKTIDEKARDIHFVAYEVIHPTMKISEQMALLEKMEFEVVQHNMVRELSNDALSKLLIDWRTNYQYEIDGVIVTDDNLHPRREGNPEHAFAFKMVISDQVAEAKVVDVLWEPSKSGYLKPRVQIEPIVLGGVTIQYATGFNGAFIESNKIGVGSVIEIVRSGDVIPHIKSVIVPAERAKMPNVSYVWTKNHVDIVLENVNEDVTVRRKNITEFFKVLEVDGLSGKTVERIMEAGYDTVGKILRMTRDDYLNVRGFKDVLATKIYEGVQDRVKKANLLDIMVASNQFGRGIGERKIKPILAAEPDILTRDESVEEKYERLIKIKGIGTENARSFVDNIERFLGFLKECGLEDKLWVVDGAKDEQSIIEEVKPVDTGHMFYGKKIVVTKVKDPEVKKKIKEVGGILEERIGKDTDYLVVKSLDDVSNKIKAAKEKGVKIVVWDDVDF